MQFESQDLTQGTETCPRPVRVPVCQAACEQKGLPSQAVGRQRSSIEPLFGQYLDTIRDYIVPAVNMPQLKPNSTRNESCLEVPASS